MKILKNNYNNIDNYNNIVTMPNPYPRKLICENCQSELEYDKSDLRIGFLGCAHLDCPVCGHENMLDDNENSITLTPNNVEFPTHFWHTSKETGAKDCCNNETIKKYIIDGIRYFRNNKDEFAWYAETGNLHIVIYRFTEDKAYNIVVNKDHYSTEIPFETEDY